MSDINDKDKEILNSKLIYDINDGELINKDNIDIEIHIYDLNNNLLNSIYNPSQQYWDINIQQENNPFNIPNIEENNLINNN